MSASPRSTGSARALRRAGLLAVALGAMLVPSGAGAQTCNAVGIPSSCSPTDKTIQINLRVTVRATVTPTVATITSPTSTEYNLGFSEMLGHTVEVKSNLAWQLLIRGSQTNFTAGGGGRANKPRTDLRFATSLLGPWTNMPGNNAASNLLVTSGSATASTNVSIFYRLIWAWAVDRPGTYTLPVVITLTAP